MRFPELLLNLRQASGNFLQLGVGPAFSPAFQLAPCSIAQALGRSFPDFGLFTFQILEDFFFRATHFLPCQPILDQGVILPLSSGSSSGGTQADAAPRSPFPLRVVLRSNSAIKRASAKALGDAKTTRCVASYSRNSSILTGLVRCVVMDLD
jgi:hypothetical protein